MKAPGRARGAFTLVEMMVVIAIIVGMLVLTVGVATTLRRSSEIRETETILSLLEQASNEWATQAERLPTWGLKPNSTSDFPYDLYADVDGQDQLTHYLTNISKTPAVREILGRIDTDYFTSFTDTTGASAVQKLRVVDPWGNRIMVLHPGPVAPAGAEHDADGTVRTLLLMCGSCPESAASFEDRMGVCQNRRICFISAGPDGKFGHLRLSAPLANLTGSELDDLHDADDNIYSYPLLRPRP